VGVDPATIRRLIRCMHYGSPSETDAWLRMAPDQRLMELDQRVPPLARQSALAAVPGHPIPDARNSAEARCR